MMRWVAVWAAIGSAAAVLQAQGIKVDVSWRVRGEVWDFFTTPGADNHYAFLGSLLRAGISGQGQRHAWRLELAQSTLAGLPDNARPPSHGATYRSVNGGRDGSVFLKQLFWRWRSKSGWSLMLGRFEFSDGSERMPDDPTLQWLRRHRIQERLIGPFGFTHITRSFDGVYWAWDRLQGTLTLTLFRPTRGAFDLRANDQLTRVTVAYTSWTFRPDPQSDARFFALYYRDARPAVKVDSRPLADRQTDREAIALTTLGGHFLRVVPSKWGQTDFLAWGAWQWGDWGRLKHRAFAVAAEIGHRWDSPWRPWLRLGAFLSTGDGNPNDGFHKTFFQVLPTPRLYARFPIYNLMNNRDLFVQFTLCPHRRLTLRLEAHRLWLSRRTDLWYAGGGAFNDTAFGYAGLTSGGARRLMDVLDLSVDYQSDPLTTWTLYLARAWGKGAVRSNFAGSSATYAYLEVVRRW
ncbi:hypothetical protein HRbin17_00035 [bacterium HR17]|uniref:Alginate export domain-containing protein n=1 Tax=Candidatus Fervidibacter japonicus TaxID=2035412 RepID=A0A2H5X8N1_9BACT|nr:hypothetical protein HRbin17_00035 [bacterium HR17]